MQINRYIDRTIKGAAKKENIYPPYPKPYVCKNPFMQVNKIVVCGAGTMGSGITEVAAQGGYEVVQYDLQLEMLEKSKQSISKHLDKWIEKEKLGQDQKEVILNRIHFTSNRAECIGDVIIEAVVEQLEVKTKLFQDLQSINSPNTIFATNTSSLSINTIAQQIKYPEKLAGMHFFNPAPLMKLVEIIKANTTDSDTIQTLMHLATTMKKVPVLCKDVPGFIVNRVARPYYLEAMRLMEKGLVNNVADIDKVMESFGFKMGPFRLMDLIGMDINYAVSNIVWQALQNPDRLKPSPIQKEKVDKGQLGRKTGSGFYQYS